jgi:hypothetical protein
LRSLETFIAEDGNNEILPQSFAKAIPLAAEMRLWASGVHPGRTLTQWPELRRAVESFSTTLVDELDSTFNYVLTDKGNLSVSKLVDGASKGFGKDILDLLDEIVTEEIDESGKCLACTLYTACGFHILRSVEIEIKAYIHASTGSLPPISRRNWGEYIEQLGNSRASPELVDLVRILKAKRNPLMHPQDRLTQTEAIDLFCICQAVTGSLVGDIKRRTVTENRPLDKDFLASLTLLPTI